MKKLIVAGMVAVMVMGATAAMAAWDNDWAVLVKCSTDALAKFGASTALFGVKTPAGNTFANLTTAPNLAGSPEVNYSDAIHPYTTNYGVTAGRTYVAKFGGTPPSIHSLWWRFRAVGVAGAAVYVTAWNQTGATSQIDVGTTTKFYLFESNAEGARFGNPVWTFNPGTTATWTSTDGIGGVANTNYFSKAYTLGAADSAGGAYQYFVLTTIPEPTSAVAMLSGLVGLAGLGLRRRK